MLGINRLIIKIGGSTLKNSFPEIINLISKLHEEKDIVIVISALEGVTNELINLSQAENKELLERIIKKHEEFSARVKVDLSVIQDIFTNLDQDLKKKEKFPTKAAFSDHITSYGEILSAKIFTEALKTQGIESEFIDRSCMIKTDSTFGNANVDFGETGKRMKMVKNTLEEGKVPVIAGFLGDYNGFRTLLGRGGSDYTATVIASLINAQAVMKISDVEGIYTTDPKIVRNARLLPFVSYEEALTVSKFGMKTLHEKTIEPVNGRIPIILGKIDNGELEVGTLISSIPAKRPILTYKFLNDKFAIIGIVGIEHIENLEKLLTEFDLYDRNRNCIRILVEKENLKKRLNAIHEMIFDEVRVSVPATIANFGPGFDVFGACLKTPADIIEAEWSDKIDLEVYGYNVPKNPYKNVASVAALALLNFLGIKRGFKMKIIKGIHPSRGLGSSGASALGGALAAARLLGIKDKELIIRAAIEGEKVASGSAHGDNIIPALFGGFTILNSLDPLDVVKIDPPELKILIVIPSVLVSTKRARKVLPTYVPLKDAVKNLALASCLIAALKENDLKRIGQYLDDYLAIPYRKSLIPWFDRVRKVAINSGAYGVSLSGSGPTIFAIGEEEDLEQIGKVIVEAFNGEGIHAEFFIGEIGSGVKLVS